MKCKWLENHTSIDSTGRVRPCCTWRNTGSEPIVTDNLDDYRSSHFVKNVQQQLEKNIWPKGCKDCQLDEEANLPSMRTKLFEDYKFGYNNKMSPGKDAEIKFGNLCNLKCAMCSPYNSSLIAKEYKDMKSKGMEHNLIDRKSPQIHAWYENQSLLEKIAKQMNDMTLIKFSGGEPTVNSYLADFLKQIDNKDVYIQITTNGNNWPQKLHEEVSKFSAVKITLSLDGVDKVNEYIRYPSSWKKINNNIAKMQTLPNQYVLPVMNSTVASYNVHQMGKLWKWATDLNFFHEIQFQHIYEPSIFHPSNASEKMKKQFEKDSNIHEGLVNLLPSVMKKGQGMEKTINYFKMLDAHRGTDISVLELD